MKRTDRLKKNKIMHVIITSAFLLGLLAGCGEESETSSMEKGFDAVNSGDYEAADSYFDAALQEGNSEKEVYRAKGIAQLAGGNYDESVEDFTDALALSNGIINDMDIDISYYLAVAQFKDSDPDGAIDTYSAIIAIRPKESNAYYMRGKVYLTQGDKEKAVTDYDMAISLAPSDYDHYLRICEDLTAAGYESEGKNYIQKAAEADSKLSDYQRGVFDYYLGNYTEARNSLENANSEGNAPDDCALYLGRTYEALGDEDYALTLYEDYASEGSKAAEAYNLIGLIKMKQQDYQAALEAFESGIALNDMSSQQSLLYNRITAEEYLRDFETAKKLMADYVSRYPGDKKAARENKFLSTR